MDPQELKNFIRSPTKEELRNHVGYFRSVIDANPDRFPYYLVPDDELDDIIRRAIVMYIRLYPVWNKDENNVYWGMDTEQLIKTGNWARLALTDTSPREVIMNYVRMLVLDRLGTESSGKIYRWVLKQRQQQERQQRKEK